MTDAAVQIDFGNPKAFRTTLGQALRQLGSKTSAERFTPGSFGGLAYSLFEDRYRKFPLVFDASSLSGMKAARDYFDAVQLYVGNAKIHAESHGFRLVRISNGDRISSGCEPTGLIYEAGLGITDIVSAEHIREFLEMVKSGESELDRHYRTVVERAEQF